ncbi:MAG: NAAT family transporter [Rhodospirillaceae bacterium]|nr:NAAT family transporter [Rhodospirillaceae bacterium]
MLDVALTAFATFFVIIDPVGVVPLFVSLTPGMDALQRRRTAVRAVIIATCILLVFTLLGQPILKYLGISLPAFRIAGGLLLLLLAVDMVVVKSSGLRSTTPKEEEEATHRPDITVFPLAIPLIAGPGSITSVILLHSQHTGDVVSQAISAGVMIGVLIMLFCGLLASTHIMKILGVTGVNVITRVFGIILSAVAVSNIVEGIRGSFPALAG